MTPPLHKITPEQQRLYDEFIEAKEISQAAQQAKEEARCLFEEALKDDPDIGIGTRHVLTGFAYPGKTVEVRSCPQLRGGYRDDWKHLSLHGRVCKKDGTPGLNTASQVVQLYLPDDEQ